MIYIVVMVVIIRIICEFIVFWNICVVLVKLLCIVEGILSWVIVWLIVVLVFESDFLVGRLNEMVEVVDNFWWFIDSGVFVGCYLVKYDSGIVLFLLLIMNIFFSVLMFWV